ncbi:MAG: dihydroneopterin aldolase family protein [Thermoplasmata archaeon]
MSRTGGSIHPAALTAREALLFEAGIKLGGVFHQYLGIPVDPRTAAGLARTIAQALELQPYVEHATVTIRPARAGPIGTGRFAYRYLTPEMLDVTVQLSDGAVEVFARLRHRKDLRYPLMNVVRVRPTSYRRAPRTRGRKAS